MDSSSTSRLSSRYSRSHPIARRPSPDAGPSPGGSRERRLRHRRPSPQLEQVEPPAIRCLVVDDHPAIRIGLRDLLAMEPGFAVVNAVESAEAAVEFAQRTDFDVAIVDYQLGGHSGLWLSRRLKRLDDPPAVLIYSAFSDYLLAAACVVAEADALLGKAALGSDLYQRIRDVAAGERRLPMVPPALAESLRHRFDAGEQAIFGLLLAGISPAEICRTLGLAGHELETRQWGMLRKLERLDR